MIAHREQPSDHLAEAREAMIATMRGRGLIHEAVLDAVRQIPRETFVPANLREFAYTDAPLPIGGGQTISQPYVVALMIALLEPEPHFRVLDVGTGSGYAAAVCSRLVAEVYTVERHLFLLEKARAVMGQLGIDNVHFRHGDGTLGWSEHARYDGIVVAAAGPRPPEALKRQLAVGGRLILPAGELRAQRLLRVTRVAEDEWEQEDLGQVRFVPLIGKEGFRRPCDPVRRSFLPPTPGRRRSSVPQIIRAYAEPFEDIESGDIEPLLERLSGSRVVLLGEATHGTSEFYRMRARITRELVEREGFDIVAVEADWPDAKRVDEYVRHDDRSQASTWAAFSRFPTWMWRNEEVLDLIEWMRERNHGRAPDEQVGFYGLDLYSLYTSIGAVLEYLDEVDPAAAAAARERYACLSPWENDPAAYGRAALSSRLHNCEAEVAGLLRDLLQKRVDYAAADGDRFFDALQNARLVANAEAYYRAMFYGRADSWNLRDSHMTDTLQAALAALGPAGKAIVWAHNSHLGDARFTEMSSRGELNVGQLCRERFGDEVTLVGFGTHRGTVAAASNWDEDVEVMEVRPSREDSFERLFHDSEVPAAVLPLREEEPARALREPRLERAIGVVYRPSTELYSHYFQASLSRQFDEYIWLDETSAVTPLRTEALPALPDTFPFGV